MKILVVDDSPILRTIIREELESGGYEVSEASNGKAALLHIAKTPPDLITLDIDMPELNGFETCQRMIKGFKSHQPNMKAGLPFPIIFVTGNDTFDDRKKGFELGAMDFISKPFVKGELLNAVNKILKPNNRLQDLTALIVDDSPISRQIVKGCLQQEGLHILEAETGIDAYAILCNHLTEIDIIVANFMMPDINGGELCKKIRMELNLPDIPLIILTALNDPTKLLNLFKLGVTDYLIKPFVKEELLARINVHLEQAQLIKRQRKAMQELRKLNTMKDDLIAVCSHDLRSPLNSILGLTDLLLEKKYVEPEDHDRHVQIKASGELLLSLINDILDVSKTSSTSEDQTIKIEPISLVEIAKTSYQAIKLLASRKSQKIDYIQEIEPDESVINGNYNAWIRVINNLLSNAIKFTPEKGTIEMSVKEFDQHHVCIQVRDNGIGIDEKDIPYLFDKYTKASRSGTQGEKSTGLGLSIIKEIIQSNSGEIHVSSRPGHGTSFTIILPKVKPDIEEQSNIEEIPMDFESSEEEEMDSIKALRILMADDYELNRTVIRQYISQTPHKIDTVENGLQAVEAYINNNYDLVLLDIQMPEMDGFEAARQIRSKIAQSAIHNKATRIGIIAMTASDTEQDLKKCLEAGMDDYIAKPVRKDAFFSLLTKWTETIVSANRRFGAIHKATESNDKDHETQYPPLDYEKVLSEFGGDKEFLHDVIHKFIKQLSEQVKRLTLLIQNRVFDDIAKESHAIRGGAANLTAMALSHIASEMEHQAKNKNAATLDQLMKSLELEYNRLDTYITNL
ncbi:MAG: response regulator [Desulfobacterales bacterium]|nr:response regulator [Desulfobacterales bacterium]